jgi:hypothetical protein
MESVRNNPLLFAYQFEGVPLGTWRARLDHKAWGKSKVTELETGKKYGLSVFWGDGYRARDRKINFRDNAELGDIFEVTIESTKSSKYAFAAARKIDPDEPLAPKAPKIAVEQGRAVSAPTQHRNVWCRRSSRDRCTCASALAPRRQAVSPQPASPRGSPPCWWPCRLI